MLSSPDVLGRFAPNNYTLQAYYLPGDDSVFVYQNNEFIDECRKIEAFTTAQAEWTDADTAAMAEQAKYIAQFDRMVKDSKANIACVKKIENIKQYEAAEAVDVENKELVPVRVGDYSEEWQAASAMDSL
jgi:esterase/lipase